MVFVTGGTGFIGQHLLIQLLDKKEKIRAIYRTMPDSFIDKRLKTDVEWVQGDVLDVNNLLEVMSGAQQVYHCAGIVSFDPKDMNRMMKVNAGGTANVVNVALELGVRKMVYVSSIAAIGRSRTDNHVSEDTKWEESSLNSKYAVSKRLAEREAWRGIAEGLNVAIVNPSLVIGPGKWTDGTPRFFRQVWKGLKFYPAGTTGFVDVRDVARAMIELMESNISSERFILNGENISHYEFFSKIADTIGKPRPKIKAVHWLAELAWREEAIRSAITQNKPIVTKETARISEMAYFYDNTKIKTKLGFEFTPITTTIEWTAKEFLKSFNQKN